MFKIRIHDPGEKNYNNSSYRYVCLLTEIKSETSKSFLIKTEQQENVAIAVFNLNGKSYVISNSCMHIGGPLTKGFLDGDIVTCPWHGWKYSVKDGKSPHEGGDSVNSYDVKIKGNSHRNFQFYPLYTALFFRLCFSPKRKDMMFKSYESACHWYHVPPSVETGCFP